VHMDTVAWAYRACWLGCGVGRVRRWRERRGWMGGKHRGGVGWVVNTGEERRWHQAPTQKGD
jgi:hypothetical protein